MVERTVADGHHRRLANENQALVVLASVGAARALAVFVGSVLRKRPPAQLVALVANTVIINGERSNHIRVSDTTTQSRDVICSEVGDARVQLSLGGISQNGLGRC